MELAHISNKKHKHNFFYSSFSRNQCTSCFSKHFIWSCILSFISSIYTHTMV